MKFYFARLLLLASISLNVNAACVLPTQNVPFQLSIPAGCSVPANYKFGPHFIIFCYSQNASIPGAISWPFKGVTQNGTMPIQLKTNPNYQGFFADPQGLLLVTNTQGAALIYSCQFAF